MKSYKTYNGGKAAHGTYQKIINLIPQCDVFIDGFLGNGGIFHNLKLPKLTIVNDIDPGVIDAFNCKVLNTINTSLIVKNVCYGSLIKEYDNNLNRTVFYFDPPYMMETRKSKRKLYKFDWLDTDHDKFLTMANTVKSNCIISHYPCTKYDEMLKGWRTFDFESMTRQGLRTERVYMNFPKPDILQDYRYLGDDYINRQRIKRKIQRYLDKLESLEQDERTGILSAVIDKYNFASAQLISPVKV